MTFKDFIYILTKRTNVRILHDSSCFGAQWLVSVTQRNNLTQRREVRKENPEKAFA